MAAADCLTFRFVVEGLPPGEDGVVIESVHQERVHISKKEANLTGWTVTVGPSVILIWTVDTNELNLQKCDFWFNLTVCIPLNNRIRHEVCSKINS